MDKILSPAERVFAQLEVLAGPWWEFWQALIGFIAQAVGASC